MMFPLDLFIFSSIDEFLTIMELYGNKLKMFYYIIVFS